MINNNDADWTSNEEWKEELDKLDQQRREEMHQIASYHITKVLNLLGWIALAVLLIMVLD